MISPQTASAPCLSSPSRPLSVPVEQLVEDIATGLGLKRRGTKYFGKCPDCGGSQASDKFNIRIDGGYKCYGCELKGDIITWLRTARNTSAWAENGWFSVISSGFWWRVSSGA